MESANTNGSNVEGSITKGKSHNRGGREPGPSAGGRGRGRQPNVGGASQDVRLLPPLLGDGGSRQQRFQPPRIRPPHQHHQRRAEPGVIREPFTSSRRKKAKDRRDHAGHAFKPGGNQHDCYICCQKSDLFGVGACLHPACLECSIRVRIVGDSRACPVCRTETDTLYIVEAPTEMKDFRLPTETIPHRDGQLHAVQFASEYAIAAYERYIENKCNVCGDRGECAVFDTFAALRQHVQQTHQLTYCRLCVESVNLLAKDRRVYTKEQLERHMNGRESGEEGFRGHPKCLFCDERYYDEEEQYRHLRREHYFCGLCEADGASHFFYKNAHQLMQHYKRSHHPCNDPECVTAGIVFSNELELSIHRSRQHNFHSGRPLQLTSQLDFRFARNSHQSNVRMREENPPVVQRGGGAQADGSITPAQEHPYQIVQSAAAAQTMRIVPSSAVSTAVRIVPSANARTLPRSVGRPVTEENYRSHFPDLTPAAEQRAPLPYGAPPPGYASSATQWRPGRLVPGTIPTQALRMPAQTSMTNTSNPLSGEQFPSLSNNHRPGAATQSSSRNTVWGRGNTAELFQGKPKVPTPKRRPIIPLPDAWPEHIQATLRARELGLPDPSLPEEQLPPPSASEEESFAQKSKEKKQKKKKSKMISPASVTARGDDHIVPSHTKFESLAELDGEERENAKGRSKPRPSSSLKSTKATKGQENSEWLNEPAREQLEEEVGSAVKLQPTDDGFVKIHLDPTSTCSQQTSKASSSLASIAQGLERQRDDDHERVVTQPDVANSTEGGGVAVSEETKMLLADVFTTAKI